jgi:endonuclease/exonuclease/phosphatase family metal-dependent hydrolase
VAVVCSLVGAAACARMPPPAMAPARSGSCRSADVHWIGPADAGNRTRLDSWCAGVGQPAVFHASGNSAAIAIEDVVFVSWNVHVGNGDLESFVSDLRAGRLTGGRSVDHFVLLLQEAVRSGADVPPFGAGASTARAIAAHGPHETDIVTLARDLGLSLLYIPSMRNGADADGPAADRGSAILSTLSLDDPVAIELPGERQRRVAIFATLGAVSSAGQSVSVGVVHLDALGAPGRLWVFGTPFMRELQARSLESLLPARALVVGADLNTWHGAGEPAPRRIAQALGTPVAQPGKDSSARVLDYLFFRLPGHLAAEYSTAKEKYGSDHHPLVGWIRSAS